MNWRMASVMFGDADGQREVAFLMSEWFWEVLIE